MTARKKGNKMSNIEKVEVKTPAELISEAVKGGADLEKLKGLLELQERWEANQARKAYHEAMAKFKADPPKIEKDKSVSFGSGKAAYKHATLGNVTEKITKALSKFGLSASWRTKQNGHTEVTCRITHILGHFEETALAAPSDTSGSKNAIQAIGSTITYLERYTLLALTGLATFDQDDDGWVAAGDTAIDETQKSNIVDMLVHTQTDEAKFLKYMGAESIEAIKKSQYDKAITALKAKERRAKK